MIPFAALACLIWTADGEMREVSVQDLSALGLTFRIPPAWQEKLEAGVGQITLRAHRFSGDETCTLTEGFTLLAEEETPEWTLWRMETDDAACRRLLRTFMADIVEYSALKQAGDEEKLTSVLTGCTIDMETTQTSFAAQRAAWLSGCRPDDDWIAAAKTVPELAVSLTDRPVQEAFLTMAPEAFSAWYWQRHGMAAHPLAGRKFDCVYLGSQYCLHLLPERTMLHRLLHRCAALAVRPVLALPPVGEGQMDALLALLTDLADTAPCRPLELVANDWGLPQLLRGRDAFSLTMGILLNKRRKDVRMPLMQGFGGRGALLAENAANDAAYRCWLTDQGFERLSVEACGSPFAAPKGPLALHLPFYQMNTAGRCTLAARCETGNRGRQAVRTVCPHWCWTHAFLYPDELGMVGRYNTLFGLDVRSLGDGAYLRGMLTGVDRLVIDLM